MSRDKSAFKYNQNVIRNRKKSAKRDFIERLQRLNEKFFSLATKRFHIIS